MRTVSRMKGGGTQERGQDEQDEDEMRDIKGKVMCTRRGGL